LHPLSPIEALPAARWMRESLWGYPSVEIIHIVGFVTLVGAVAVFDLRVLGCARRIAVKELARLTLPWSLGALLLVVPSGLLMFSTHASDFISSRVFVVKMLLLFLAGCNAVFFHVGPYQTVQRWDAHLPAPFAARASAAVSLALWVGVIACGRLLAYV
jgi:hypothetical protein